jgi:hypothetical protein
VVASSLLASLGTVPVFGQTPDHGKMGKMAGTKILHDEMIGKMSTDDKATLIDEMPTRDRVAQMKASGHVTSKMSSQQKADMFDKMPMDKKMSMMMAHQSMMDKSAERQRRG